jgi:hypothetical protein
VVFELFGWPVEAIFNTNLAFDFLSEKDKKIKKPPAQTNKVL